MKVLHVGVGNLFGGIETILVTLARYRPLCPEMEQHFAVFYDTRLATELREAGATVHVLGAVRFSRPWTVLRVRRTLGRLLQELDFDAVICHSSWPLAVCGGTIRQKKCTSVVWLHSRVEGAHWTERLAGWYRPDGAICVSKDTAETLPKLFENLRHEIIYTPLPNDPEKLFVQRDAVRAEFGVAAETVVILQASRMEEWKGQRTHLNALALLKDVPNWVLWMAGGAQRPAEERFVRELKEICGGSGLNDRVQFLGNRSDVTRLMSGADIYCQPNSGPEGFSIVFLEACLSRLPIITGKLGGALEIVDERSGVLLKPGDASDCAQALRRLIGSPELRREMGQAGRERALRMCDPRGQLKKIHDFMQRLSNA